MICLNCGQHTSPEEIKKDYSFYLHRLPPKAPVHLYVRGIGQYWDCGPVVKVSDYSHDVPSRILEEGMLEEDISIKCEDGEVIKVIRFKGAEIPPEFEFKKPQVDLSLTSALKVTELGFKAEISDKTLSTSIDNYVRALDKAIANQGADVPGFLKHCPRECDVVNPSIRDCLKCLDNRPVPS